MKKAVLCALAFACAFFCILPKPALADRVLFYYGQQLPSVWLNQEERNLRLATGAWMTAAMGNVTTGFYANLAAAPVGTAQPLYVHVAPAMSGTIGSVNVYGADDTNAVGTGSTALPADLTQLFLTGIVTSNSAPIGPVTVPTAGLTQVTLLEATVVTSDTNSQSVNFVSQSGVLTAGTANETRADAIVFQLKAGTAASSGATAPAADTGYVPIATITVPAGTTQITTGMIASVGGFSGFALQTNTPTYTNVATTNLTASANINAGTVTLTSGVTPGDCLKAGTGGLITDAGGPCGTSTSVTSVVAGTNISVTTGSNPVISTTNSPTFSTSVTTPSLAAPSGSNLSLASNASSAGFATLNYGIANQTAGLRVYDGSTTNYSVTQASGFATGGSSFTNSNAVVAGPVTAIGPLTVENGSATYAGIPSTNYIAVGTPGTNDSGSINLGNNEGGSNYFGMVSGDPQTINGISGTALTTYQANVGYLTALDTAGNFATAGTLNGTRINAATGGITGALTAGSVTAPIVTAGTANTAAGAGSLWTASAASSGGIGFGSSATAYGSLTMPTLGNFTLSGYNGAAANLSVGGGQFQTGSSYLGPTGAVVNGPVTSTTNTIIGGNGLTFSGTGAGSNWIIEDAGATSSPILHMGRSDLSTQGVAGTEFDFYNSGVGTTIASDLGGNLGVRGNISAPLFNSTSAVNSGALEFINNVGGSNYTVLGALPANAVSGIYGSVLGIAAAGSAYDFALDVNGNGGFRGGVYGSGAYNTTGSTFAEYKSGTNQMILGASGGSVAGINSNALYVYDPTAGVQELAMDYIGDVGINGSYYTASERRLKANIVPLADGIASELAANTRIYQFCYKTEKCKPGQEKHIGFIADDTSTLLAPDHKAMDVNAVAAIALKAVQELQRKVTALTAQVKALQAKALRAVSLPSQTVYPVTNFGATVLR